jgi:hypothetical protein
MGLGNQMINGIMIIDVITGNQMINGIMIIDVITENRNDHEIK